ncbi:hypothetical protein [Halosolutus halophilus]|uniref:hypothetical protein n=1 Tax=Halosolutus halophilus TaxID=1552990 RepID=UPI0022352D42|nr:hypothetical protein [Halosolutus halophilus]
MTITETNDPVSPDETFEVSVAIENRSEMRDRQEIVLDDNGQEGVVGEWVDLASGDSDSVTLRCDTDEDDIGDVSTMRTPHRQPSGRSRAYSRRPFSSSSV